MALVLVLAAMACLTAALVLRTRAEEPQLRPIRVERDKPRRR